MHIVVRIVMHLFLFSFDAKAAMSKRSQQSSSFSNMFVPDMHVVC